MSTTVDVGTVDIPVGEPPQNKFSGGKFVYKVVGAVALAHLLNDLIQAVIPAIYPMLKAKYSLSFSEIGWLAMVYQLTASLLQPAVGFYTDKNYKPYLLPIGMAVTLVGILALAFSPTYLMLIIASSIIGIGSATFHPEASRMARLASGGKFGTAQSAFQVGGNAGSAMGPLVASILIVPFGQDSFAWLAIIAIAAIWILFGVSKWRLLNGESLIKLSTTGAVVQNNRRVIVRALAVVCLLMFAKFIYIASFTNYFTFYLIERFQVSTQVSQLYLFAFLAAIAAGTFFGGPVGDRIGRKSVIWVSFLGVAPFALMLPYVDLFWTSVLAIIIGLVMSSAFAALVVYAQELVPGRVGMVSGAMFGLMFGFSGIGAAALGNLADANGIIWVYQAVSYLPLLGLATAFLPSFKK